jgi:hypothetical protein
MGMKRIPYDLHQSCQSLGSREMRRLRLGLARRLVAWLEQAGGDGRQKRGSFALDRAELTDVFRKLGCPDPEVWANSQIDEGINQLGRYLFIRDAWAEAVPFEATDWIDNVLMNCPADTSLGASWRRVLASGAQRIDIAAIVRAAQGEMIFSICSNIDDPDDHDDPDRPPIRWSLFETDAEGTPVAEIGFLHEDVLELDPALKPELR